MVRRAKPSEDVSEQADGFYAALNGESPLACALIAGAAIEQAMMSLLRKRFIPKSNTADSFFGPGGMLGDYRRCAELTYCFGLIPKPMYQTICVIGDIRNLFAHSPVSIDFSDTEVAKQCKKLDMPTNRSPDAEVTKALEKIAADPRVRFSFVASRLFDRLLLLASTHYETKECDWEW